MDLDDAIGKHAEWKRRFRDAISKAETMDAQAIAKDNCCEIGLWLHGDAKRQFGSLASHADCLEKHAAFHVEAGRIAVSINARRFSEAAIMIGSGSRYAQASVALSDSILRLKKEAGL